MDAPRKTIDHHKMAIIIQRIAEVDAELRFRSGVSRTLLSLPLEWLMEAAVSDVVVEQEEAA